MLRAHYERDGVMSLYSRDWLWIECCAGSSLQQFSFEAYLCRTSHQSPYVIINIEFWTILSRLIFTKSTSRFGIMSDIHRYRTKRFLKITTPLNILTPRNKRNNPTRREKKRLTPPPRECHYSNLRPRTKLYYQIDQSTVLSFHLSTSAVANMGYSRLTISVSYSPTSACPCLGEVQDTYDT